MTEDEKNLNLSRIANHQKMMARLKTTRISGTGHAKSIKFKIDQHEKAIEELSERNRS